MNFIKSSIFTYIQNSIPSCSAVFGKVKTSVSTFFPQRAISCNKYSIRISWIYFYHSNMLGVFESYIFKRVPSVRRFVYSISISNRTLVIVFACSYPNYIVIVWVNCNTTDGVGPLIIKNGLKRCSCINCFPYTARGSCHIPSTFPSRINSNI